MSLSIDLDWPGAQQVGMIQGERTRQGTRMTDTEYFISSLDHTQAVTQRFLEISRGHRGAIENGCMTSAMKHQEKTASRSFTVTPRKTSPHNETRL